MYVRLFSHSRPDRQGDARSHGLDLTVHHHLTSIRRFYRQRALLHLDDVSGKQVPILKRHFPGDGY
jgi:hypothetical protein